MLTRKQLIEEIAADFHAIKNKMHGSMMNGQKGNITYAQQFALLVISQTKGQGIKEISKMLYTSSSAATQLVNELVRQKLVTRKTNVQDRRALDLTISKKGQAQITLLKKMHQKMMASLFLPLTDKELGHFMVLNKKILNNI